MPSYSCYSNGTIECSVLVKITTVPVFCSNDNGPQIAILHPRLLTIYSLERAKGKVQEIENYRLLMLYQHNLSRSSYSLTVGPFGRVKNRDFMCVQSIDGTLNLFEQESFSFSRFLPGFLLPGQIEFAKRTDSFVTVSSSHQLESYRLCI